MKTDPDTIRLFLVQVRDCAMQMMENGAFIQKQLPSLRMPDALRQKLDAFCENLIGTKHDLIHEIFEIDGLLDDSPENLAIAQGIERIRQWVFESIMEIDDCVNEVQRAVGLGEADGLLSILLMESGRNILSVTVTFPEVRPETSGAKLISEQVEVLRIAREIEAERTNRNNEDAPNSDMKPENAICAADFPTGTKFFEIEDVPIACSHNKPPVGCFTGKPRPLSDKTASKLAYEREITPEEFDAYVAGAISAADEDEADEEDGYDPNCYAFHSEDSWPIKKLVASVRRLKARPNLPAETAETLKIFLFAMERLPLVTPGVRMSLGLRLDQGGESDWIEIRMEDDEFTLGRGAWVDGEADTETVFEVTPGYRDGDAFIATHFAESFSDCARDVCREVVIEDFSDEPFTAWDLPQDKERWNDLPCSFL
jgi:predicted DNA-binding protein